MYFVSMPIVCHKEGIKKKDYFVESTKVRFRKRTDKSKQKKILKWSGTENGTGTAGSDPLCAFTFQSIYHSVTS